MRNSVEKFGEGLSKFGKWREMVLDFMKVCLKLFVFTLLFLFILIAAYAYLSNTFSALIKL